MAPKPKSKKNLAALQSSASASASEVKALASIPVARQTLVCLVPMEVVSSFVFGLLGGCRRNKKQKGWQKARWSTNRGNQNPMEKPFPWPSTNGWIGFPCVKGSKLSFTNPNRIHGTSRNCLRKWPRREVYVLPTKINWERFTSHNVNFWMTCWKMPKNHWTPKEMWHGDFVSITNRALLRFRWTYHDLWPLDTNVSRERLILYNYFLFVSLHSQYGNFAGDNFRNARQ